MTNTFPINSKGKFRPTGTILRRKVGKKNLHGLTDVLKEASERGGKVTPNKIHKF